MSQICSRKVNFSQWYDDVIFYGNLATHGLVKGTVFIHPKTCYIWKKIQDFIDVEFSAQGIKNVMFPALIPMAEIEKEKAQLTGFVPELFLVKSSNADNNKQSMFLRPTSEILFSHYFRNKLEKYDDLPILVNQWSSVYRSEKNTKIFLRNSEFYWQEAHTIHKTEECANRYLQIFHSIYEKLITEFLQISVLIGEKTVNERFQGADKTLTIEGIMQDGQTLQMATSHSLGKNFSKIFDIKYTNEKNVKDFPYQLSAGCSTRLIGALIMSHSDDRGLVLPWELSEIKVKVLVLDSSISKGDDTFHQIEEALKTISHEWCFSNKTFGHKITAAEQEGIPLLLVVGKQEIAKKQVMIKSRVKDEKSSVNIGELGQCLLQEVKDYNKILKDRNLKNLQESIVEGKTLEDAIRITDNKKVALLPWFSDSENEDNLKAEKYNFGPRCIKKFINDSEIKCFYSQKPANCMAYFARSY